MTLLISLFTGDNICHLMVWINAQIRGESSYGDIFGHEEEKLITFMLSAPGLINEVRVEWMSLELYEIESERIE